MDYRRQLGILDPSSILFPVTLIGCGGIGSPTALMLAKMGCQKLSIIDFDTVENHNLPSQLFPLSDVGIKKVEACKRMVNQFSDCSVTAVPQRFGGNGELSGIVISGVDTMSARMEIWKRVKFNPEVPLYIDGRIGREIIQVYSIQPSQIEDVELYEKSLFPDEEAAELPCTERAIMYTGFGIAAMIGSQFKKWVRNEERYRRISFDFKTMSIVLQ
jgi:predicted ThiF/HesA family dinucleotide-utilizing enzyme